MTGTILLTIFILINVFIMGILAVIGYQHARAHFRPAKTEKTAAPLPAIPSIYLPAATKERLIQTTQVELQQALKHSADRLQQDLAMTSEQMNNLIRQLATQVVSEELGRYRTELTKLHEQTAMDMSGIRRGMVAHQEELKARLAQEVEAAKQLRIKQIDTKLADAVASFLLEALQHNVDLGSQNAYLVGLLEAHKADFIKEVGNEAQTT